MVHHAVLLQLGCTENHALHDFTNQHLLEKGREK